MLVVGSDGLFDNLYDAQIIDLLRPFLRDRDDLIDPKLCAELISEEAENYSYKQRWVSPFSKSAHDHYLEFTGGKPDDITVVVA